MRPLLDGARAPAAAAPPTSAAATSPSAAPSSTRLHAIDWLRGLVMVLMTVDHASGAFNAGRLFKDAAFAYHPGEGLPAAQFLTRWITHLCAPTFVFLAGASLALSSSRRQAAGEPAGSIDRQMVVRGLFILALDPLWMSLAFMGWQRVLLQVLYAIGLSMVCMALLRRLPPWLLAVAGAALVVGVDLAVSPSMEAAAAAPAAGPGSRPGAPWAIGLLVSGGFYKPLGIGVIVGYPLASWLGIMMLGFAFGALVHRRGGHLPTAGLVAAGLAALAAFCVVRGVDGPGNMGMHRDDLSLLQWLHVAKYPPSVSYCLLELGLMALLLAGLSALGRGGEPRWLRPLGVLGGSAMLYYLLHAHLLEGASLLLGLHGRLGLGATWLAAAICTVALYFPCRAYMNYKLTHPSWLTRLL